MNKTTFIQSNSLTQLEIPLYMTCIKAGFPSPADDYIDQSIDLNRYLIPNPSSTFMIKVSGDSMIDSSINTGDLLVVDKSLKPKNRDIIVACINGEFTVKHYEVINGIFFLIPSNKKYSSVQIKEGMEFECWGVVTAVIHTTNK